MVLLRAACVALLTALASISAHAEEHTIVVHHMELQMIEGTMHVGDVLTFDNQSDMAHNLYVIYADGTVDNLDTQIPGTQKKLTLRQAGPAVVKCWIHPIIKAEMSILPEAKSEKP